MLAVESGPDGQPWFVGFEWIGRADYLNEAGRSGARTRGANATSADAVVRFENEGRIESVLIEWKYTESYGAPIPPGGNEVRLSRYRDLVFEPSGPIRADLSLAIGDFFWEPLYQLLRQQMLAFQMQSAHEDGAECVRVLHISPSANDASHTVTAPALQCYGDYVLRSVPQPLGATRRLHEPLHRSGSLHAEVVEDHRPWQITVHPPLHSWPSLTLQRYASPSYSLHSRDFRRRAWDKPLELLEIGC